MAQFGAPTVAETKVLTPRPNYEFICVDVNEVPNDKGEFAYNPAKDDPKKATKWEWVFKGRPGTDAEGVTIKKRTVSYMTTDSRNGWLVYSKAIDPTFDPKVGYASEEDFKSRVIGMPVMLAISNSTGINKQTGEPTTYNNIDKPYPSSLGKLSVEDGAKLIGATVTGSVPAGEDIPF